MEDIDQKYATVGDLLAATYTDGPLLGDGAGRFAMAHHFPYGIGFDRFGLRTRKGITLDELKYTTALTPVGSQLIGHNTGQAMLKADNGTSIMIVHPGSSLSCFLREHPPKQQSRQLYQLIQSLQAASGKNPFIPLIEQAVGFYMEGYKPDPNLSNIMLNRQSSTLELIDCMNGIYDPRRKSISKDSMLHYIKSELLNYLSLYIPTDQRPPNDDSYNALRDMIDEATDYLLSPRGQKTIKPLNFDDAPTHQLFTKITGTQAVKAGHRPHVLLERLRIQEQRLKLHNHK